MPSHHVVTLLMQRTQVRVLSPLASKLLRPPSSPHALSFKCVCVCVHGGMVMRVVCLSHQAYPELRDEVRRLTGLPVPVKARPSVRPAPHFLLLFLTWPVELAGGRKEHTCPTVATGWPKRSQPICFSRTSLTPAALSVVVCPTSPRSKSWWLNKSEVLNKASSGVKGIIRNNKVKILQDF